MRYSTGECDAMLEVTDGILAVEGVHLPNTAGSIDAGVRANSPSATRIGNKGRFQGVDVNMGATNVEDAIVVGSTSTVVLQGINIFNVQNTFHLTSNSSSLLVTSGLSDPAVNDIKVDAGLTGDSAILRIMSYMNGVFDIPTTWIPSDHAWTLLPMTQPILQVISFGALILQLVTQRKEMAYLLGRVCLTLQTTLYFTNLLLGIREYMWMSQKRLKVRKTVHLPF